MTKEKLKKLNPKCEEAALLLKKETEVSTTDFCGAKMLIVFNCLIFTVTLLDM
jgi:hypothetical protein